jgi:eukaryotic-like serine/threonine-protein kinase
MGEVYLARDTRLERDVALKLLPELLHQDQTARERFLREARAASKLAHPNIVTIHAIESFDGRDGIVMEFIDGLPLDQFRSQPDRTINQLVDVGLQIADGLTVAHAAGIVHRDLKPSNVLVDHSGRARILDFGLALTSHKARLTGEGMIVGSPAYMSPEQIRGQEIDHRSDIFSFGILFYELVSGVHPFWSEDATAILYSIVNDHPSPLSSQAPHLNSDWNDLIDRCLAKAPDDRFPSSGELAKELRTVIVASGFFDPVSTRSRSLLATEPSARTPSVAVLPMIDLSPEKDQEYFCDGLAEELINALSRISGLRVVARTSAFSFKGQNLDVRTIGSKLGVTSVLEGSVRKHGNRLRITAQLINVADGYHSWSERFDRDAGDIFAIQDEIAQTVAERLRLKLGSLPSAPTHDVEAYNLYLLGRFHWNKRTNESMRKALESYEAAIARDPGFALAHAGIADSLLILEDHGFIGYRDAIARARTAVERALAIDPDLAEAHTAMGGIHAELREFDQADRAFRRAIQSKPGYATAHHWYATQMLLEVGRVADAEREILKARELDPLSLIINTDLARHYYYTRDFKRARELVTHVLSLDPHFIKAQRLMFLTLWQMGDHSHAVTHIPHWLPAYAGFPRDDNNWGKILSESGFPGVLKRLLEVMNSAKSGYPLHYAKATIHAQLSELDQAVDALAHNVDVRSPNFAGMRMDALLDPLRSFPPFVELLKSLGI